MGKDIGKSIVNGILNGILSQLPTFREWIGPVILAALTASMIWLIFKGAVRSFSIISGDSKRLTKRKERKAKTWFKVLTAIRDILGFSK